MPRSIRCNANGQKPNKWAVNCGGHFVFSLNRLCFAFSIQTLLEPSMASMLNKLKIKINKLINLSFLINVTYSKITFICLENWLQTKKFRHHNSSSTFEIDFELTDNRRQRNVTHLLWPLNLLKNARVPRRRLVKAVNECKTQATIAKKFKSKFVGQIEKKKWLKNRSSRKGELEESKLKSLFIGHRFNFNALQGLLTCAEYSRQAEIYLGPVKPLIFQDLIREKSLPFFGKFTESVYFGNAWEPQCEPLSEQFKWLGWRLAIGLAERSVSASLTALWRWSPVATCATCW